MATKFSRFCCQLNEVGGFHDRSQEFCYQVIGRHFRSAYTAPGNASFATTITEQRPAIAALKKRGFRRVARWYSQTTGNTITLWFCSPEDRARHTEKDIRR